MYSVRYLSPMIPSYDMAKTAEFFSLALGFTKVFHSESYAVYEKDRHTIHILPAGNDVNQMEFYLEVDGLEKVWETVSAYSQNLKLRPPFDRQYGMREIHVEIPATNTLLFIGQVIRKD